MAFNPFTSFQRNQKFWMATVLLLCMITFVFCTGVGGDLSDRLITLFRPKGAAVGSVAGQSITRGDLYDLRRQRDTANEFMRSLVKEAIKNYGDKIKAEADKMRTADEKQRQGDEFRKKQQMIQEFSLLRAELMARLQQPRYFEIGNRLDDVIEFMIWQAQADRLGIALTEDYVRQMVLNEVFGFVTREQLIGASMEARRGNQNASDSFLSKALTDEFRVRLAQLATLTSQPSDYNRPGDIRITDPLQPTEVRAPMSPAMMWDFYKQKRSEFDVKLIPIHVADFVKDMPAPGEADQESYFRRFQNDTYDPTSPTPGLQIPAKAKAAFVMADPNAPAYLDQARARLLLPLVAPCLDPLQSAPILAARVLGAEAAYQAALERAYGSISQVGYRGAAVTDTDVMSPLTAWLAKRDARSAASFVANVAGGMAGQVVVAPFTTPHAMAGYLAWGAGPSSTEVLNAALRAEIRERAPVYNAMFAGALQPWTLVSALNFYDQLNPPLPLAVVRRDIEDIMAHERAEQWARDNMRVVRDKIEKLTGSATAFNLALGKYIDEYKLHYSTTKDFYNRYTIDKAPELEPLRQQFQRYIDQINFLESRDLTPERLLKSGDFYKLFFGGERFTTEGLYRALPWPPVVLPGEPNIHQRRAAPPPDLSPALQAEFLRFMHNQDPARPKGMFDLFSYAEKPSLYWKTAEVGADKPQNLAQVRDRVIEGWKLDRAREDKGLALARTIAADLQQKEAFNNDVLQAEVAKGGHPIIELPNLAALYAERTGQFGLSREYVSYPLPKDVFSYPRDDMVQQLLKLYDLSKPIQISSGEGDLPIKRQLDALNKELWEKTTRQHKKDANGKYVQVLTNRPLTEFYVAVVPFAPLANRDDFFAALQRSPWMAEIEAWMRQMRVNPRMPAPPSDPFMVLAQKDEGKRVRDAVIEQLKTEFKVEMPNDAELRADFDRGN